jgi:nicotinamidase-related amidase
MPPILIILDPQNDFFGSDNPNLVGFLETIPVINRAIEFFHSHNWPVIFIQHASVEKPKGSKQWEIFEEFRRSPEDIFLTKVKQNAFEGSPLQDILVENNAQQLIFAGYIAEFCVLKTYRAAVLLGYSAFVLKNGTASLDHSLGIETNPYFRTIAQLELLEPLSPI